MVGDMTMITSLILRIYLNSSEQLIRIGCARAHRDTSICVYIGSRLQLLLQIYIIKRVDI
jgi:hypothetical protein